MRSLFVLLLAAGSGCQIPESPFEIQCEAVADLGYFDTKSACVTSRCDIRDLNAMEAHDACLAGGGEQATCDVELEILDPLCRNDTTLPKLDE